MLDGFGHHEPRLLSFSPDGATATFDITAAIGTGKGTPRRHVFGAVRFMKGQYSSVQLIQSGLKAPSAEYLDVLRNVVNSFQMVPATR